MEPELSAGGCLCGARDAKTLFPVKERYAIKKCRACGLVYLDPRPRIPVGNPEASWSVSAAGGRRARGFLLSPLYGRELNLITKFAPGQEAALDVGCGRGDFAAVLQTRFLRAVGLEPAAAACNAARARHPQLEFIEAEVGDAELSAESFDAASLINVLEHDQKPRELLLQLQRLLKPGGALLVQVPGIDTAAFRLGRERYFGLYPPQHLWFWQRRTLAELARQTGFSLVYHSRRSWRCNPPAWACTLFPGLNPVALRARNNRTGLYLLAAASFACLGFDLSEALWGYGATETAVFKKTCSD